MKLRNILSALLGVVLITLSSSVRAQSWTPPTPPAGSSPIDGESYFIMNVGTGQFLTAANRWATQISLGTDSQPYMRFRLSWRNSGDYVSYIFRENEYTYDRSLTTFDEGYMIQVDGQFYVNSSEPVTRTNWHVGDTYLFRDSEESGFVDLNRTEHGYLWKFTPYGNGSYFIQTIESDSYFPDAASQYAAAYKAGAPVIFNATSTDEYSEWRLYASSLSLDVTRYAALRELYAALNAAYEAGVSTTAAEAIYNNSTASTDEIRDAAAVLREQVSSTNISSLIEGASSDNPVDLTDYAITNAAFDEGSLNGWTIEGWTPGSSVQSNVMYQGASYTNGSVTISGFIESWCPSNYGSLSDGAFLQTLYGLPAGRYRLEADCIAVNQSTGSEAIGATLFAETADGTIYKLNIGTANESPLHFELNFNNASEGNITIGLRTEGTNINWIAGDNFRLVYFGNEGSNGGEGVDITASFITNPSPYANTDGWDTPYGQPNAFDSGNRCAEFWNCQGYKLQQTLHNLPAGDYTLTAIAFTRSGFTATLFAGDASVQLVTVGSNIVNNRSEANTWFEAGNGVNRLNFTMPAAGDITIGINAATEGDGWTVWRSFTLTTGSGGTSDHAVGSSFTISNGQGHDLTFTVTSASTCALTAAPDVDGLTIPAEADGLQVTEIGEGVFQTANLTSINLPTTIQTIGQNAFRGSKLTALPYLPNLRSIGTYAFYACTGLTEIVLGPSVESIGNYAFFGNSNITSVVVQATTPPTGQSNIFSSKVYSNATLTLSEGTKSAYQNASPWSSFTTIIDGTELKDGDTFSYTYQGVTLQYTVLSASNMTCSVNGGADVSTVTVPTIANNYTVVAVGDGAFQDASLTSINLPTTIQTIGQNAFRGSQLATFPDLPNLRTIGNYAFYGCTNLTKITLGAKVTSIGGYAFFGNGNVTSITVLATTPPTAQSTSFSTTVYTNATLTVPEGRKSAYQNASPWSSFTTITDGTEPKDGDTFSYTYKGVPLEYTVLSVNNMTCSVTGGAASPSVSVPTTANGYTVVAIGDRTFQNIKTLENITLPSTLQTIGAYAFYATGLTTINIPASVTSIGSYAFYGISGITQVTVNSETPPTAQSTSFASNTYTNAELRLNKGGKAAYASTEPWSRFKNVFDATGKYITIVVEGNGTVSYTNVEGKTFTASTGSTDIPLDEDVNPITLQLSAAMGSRFEKAVYDKVTEQEDYTSRVKEDGSLSMGVYRGGTTLTVTFAERQVWHLNVLIVGNGSLSYTNSYGQTFTAGTGSTSIPIYEDENPVTFHIAAAEGYRYSEATYDKVTAVEDYTSRLKEDGSFAMGVYRDGTTLTVTFVKRNVDLYVLRKGNGTVKLNGEVLTFNVLGVASPDVSKMKDFLFTFQPDAGFRLDHVLVDEDDVTNRVDSNGNLDLGEVFVDGEYWMEVDFVEGFPAFASDDCTFGIPDPTKNEVRVMPRNYLNRDVLIPETVERNGTTYTVTSVEDAAFAGNEQLRSVSLPSTIQSVGSNLFDGCTHLAAIVWNRTLPFPDEAMGSFRNPNLLFYTKYSSHAPQNSGVNILWKGDNDYYQSNKVIRLQEGINGFDFYCPIPFYAAQIEYVHQFTMETQPQTAKGWETLVLPFTVKNVYHNNLRRDIVPYATVSEDDVIHGAHPFWLYTYSADGDKAWVEADSIRANQPYIISMPNNSKYPADYQMAGKVTFTAKNAWIPATEEVSVTRGSRTLHANFQTQDVPSYYLLNVKNDFFRNSTGRDDGSTFVLRTKFADSRPAMPFECYFTTTAASVKEIGLFEEVVNAVRELPADLSEKEVEGIYDLSGRKIANGQGTVDKGQLSRGIYIVNGRKVLVR